MAEEPRRHNSDRCAALAEMKIPDVAFETIEVVTSGTFKSVAGETHRDCRRSAASSGVATPRPASSIGFEVWLPLENWNGRYVQVGNGGLAGVIFYLELARHAAGAAMRRRRRTTATMASPSTAAGPSASRRRSRTSA